MRMRTVWWLQSEAWQWTSGQGSRKNSRVTLDDALCGPLLIQVRFVTLVCYPYSHQQTRQPAGGARCPQDRYRAVASDGLPSVPTIPTKGKQARTGPSGAPAHYTIDFLAGTDTHTHCGRPLDCRERFHGDKRQGLV